MLSETQVLVVLSASAHGLPAPTVESITGPPWVGVVGVWVLDSDDPIVLLRDTPSGAAAMRDALYSDTWADRSLPQLLPTDREFNLAVVVEVVDCSAMSGDDYIYSEGLWASAQLRSAISGPKTVLLPELHWLLDPQSLTSKGVCNVG